MVEKLDHNDVADRLNNYEDWERQGPWLRKLFTFDDFQEALDFVNDLGDVAEDLNHHPDITIQNYNEVMVNLTTHDVNGVSEQDFTFIDSIETDILG